MPKKPMKPCKYSRCPNLTQDTYCSEHRKLLQIDLMQLREDVTVN